MEQMSQPFWQSPAFWIVLIAVLGVIAAVALVRGNLSGLRIKSGKIDAQMTTREPRTLEISGIQQTGEKHVVETERNDTNLKDIKQHGKGHQVSARK